VPCRSALAFVRAPRCFKGRQVEQQLQVLSHIRHAHKEAPRVELRRVFVVVMEVQNRATVRRDCLPNAPAAPQEINHAGANQAVPYAACCYYMRPILSLYESSSMSAPARRCGCSQLSDIARLYENMEKIIVVVR